MSQTEEKLPFNPSSKNAFQQAIELSNVKGFGVAYSPALPEPMNSLILRLVDEITVFFNKDHMKFFKSREGLEIIQDSFWYLMYVLHGEEKLKIQESKPHDQLSVFQEGVRLEQERVNALNTDPDQKNIDAINTAQNSKPLDLSGGDQMEKARLRAERLEKKAQQEKAEMVRQMRSRLMVGGRYITLHRSEPDVAGVLAQRERQGRSAQRRDRLPRMTEERVVGTREKKEGKGKERKGGEDEEEEEDIDFARRAEEEQVRTILLTPQTLPSSNKQSSSAMFDRLALNYVGCIMDFDDNFREAFTEQFVEELSVLVVNCFANAFPEKILSQEFRNNAYSTFHQLFKGFKPSWPYDIPLIIINSVLYAQATKTGSDATFYLGKMKDVTIPSSSTPLTAQLLDRTRISTTSTEVSELTRERLAEEKMEEAEMLQVARSDEFIAKLIDHINHTCDDIEQRAEASAARKEQLRQSAECDRERGKRRRITLARMDSPASTQTNPSQITRSTPSNAHVPPSPTAATTVSTSSQAVLPPLAGGTGGEAPTGAAQNTETASVSSSGPPNFPSPSVSPLAQPSASRSPTKRKRFLSLATAIGRISRSSSIASIHSSSSTMRSQQGRVSSLVPPERKPTVFAKPKPVRRAQGPGRNNVGVCDICGRQLVRHSQFNMGTISPIVMRYFELKKIKLPPSYATHMAFTQNTPVCTCSKLIKGTRSLRDVAAEVLADNERLLRAHDLYLRRVQPGQTTGYGYQPGKRRLPPLSGRRTGRMVQSDMGDTMGDIGMTFDDTQLT